MIEPRHTSSFPYMKILRNCSDYKCLRMPYGISSALEFFQFVIDEMLKGLEGVICVIYLDNVLMAGASIEECQTLVDAVLARFQLHGVSKANVAAAFRRWRDRPGHHACVCARQ